MALNDAATLVVDSGNYFTAVVDTLCPTDLAAPPVAWEKIGHTSIENIMGFAADGGDATTIATLQNKTLRTKYSARTESFTINLEQFDTPSLKLYYGSNMVDVLADGTLMGVPTNPTPTIKAFLAIFTDGANAFGFYAPKAEIFRGDNLDIANTTDLANLPLSIKPLISGTNDWAYAVTPLGAV